MANLVQRFLRNQSCLRAIPRLNPNLTTHQKPCISNVVEFDPAPLTNPVITVADKSLQFYPSFPIGYGFNPTAIHDSGLIDADAVAEEKGEKEMVIYADSVKKKRKKKMNKHKYRKLRKEMGRKT
ncbi:unnamed protein product [Microthlaspi erraticum]|uniref:Small ribosomal subunit protein mS38 n=1 Tax=Microthlaspi erraticum TaxID=1685480 RepID=A0A6D2KT18_9BRAS|nr:unnamed protein product [Microthlaspi erraticum]